MNHQYQESSEVIESDELRHYRAELLDKARHLDHFGKRFEKYMSMQLQRLEMAMDRFEREKEAWQRQRQRELAEIADSRPVDPISSSPTTAPKTESSSHSQNVGVSQEQTGNSTAPLLALIEPGEVSAMQLGLLLFEVSKMNREFGGGGVRFEVNAVRLSKRTNLRGKLQPIIGIEAFSAVPLLNYDSSPTRELVAWEVFKSKILMSSLIDASLLKNFKKAAKAPRDHDSVMLAHESTLRAENANSKCDLDPAGRYEGFLSNKKTQQPKQQQLQRVEEVYRYLNKEYGLRMHVSLVW